MDDWMVVDAGNIIVNVMDAGEGGGGSASNATVAVFFGLPACWIDA